MTLEQRCIDQADAARLKRRMNRAAGIYGQAATAALGTEAGES